MPPIKESPSSEQSLQIPGQSSLSACQAVLDYDQSKDVSQLWENTEHRGVDILDEFLDLDESETESFDLSGWAPDDFPSLEPEE